MKKTSFIYILLVFVTFSTQSVGQYSLKSKYLLEPELIKGHVDSCALFWLPTYDKINGGFYQDVSRSGEILGTSKTMLGQTRTAYGMVKAFMLSGNTNYLTYARGALDFMYENAWDNNNLGWFNELNEDGSLRSNGEHNNDKWSFMQHYALLGIASMVEATDTKIDWQYLNSGRLSVDSLLWDSRTDYLGYYNEANVDWSNPNGKGFTPTADAVTTHGLSMYLITREEDKKKKLITLADNLNDHLVANMSNFNYGFPEAYNNDWEANLNDTYVFTGHLLKAAWCLTRAYLIEKNEKYLEGSTTLLNHVLEYGYDHINGGCFTNYNGLNGTRYNNSKEWWQLEQSFTSSIMNYYISHDERFLRMADETIEFYMNNMVDHNYGEVFTSTNSDGTVDNDTKASYWKAGYHSIELGYFVYLYTNLYVHEKPVKIYYNFEPIAEKRELVLTPLAIEDNKLKIQSVKLNGQNYTNFVGTTRTLAIPENEGGVFEVNFNIASPTNVVDELLPSQFKLHNNYPNPFNPSTKIIFDIYKDGNVELNIYDILGNKVKELANSYYQRGNYNIIWDGTNNNKTQVSGGIYIIQLKHKNNVSVVKAVLVK